MTRATDAVRILLMEDHDGAYWAWKDAGVKERPLVHFDAHLDFNWIAPSASSLLDEPTLARALERAASTPFWSLARTAPEARVNLGNYVHEALSAGLVSEFVWIYPDDPERARQADAVERILSWVASGDPRRFSFSRAGEVFTGRVLGKPFRAAPLSRLSAVRPEGEVLLDVDVDFLIVRSLYAAEYPVCDPREARPWLAPGELVSSLARAGLRFDIATIAYSVEEGYTPARLKYLGDELAGRLAGPLSSEDAALFDALGSRAPEALEAALRSRRAPSALFNLAMIRAAAGDFARAKPLYEEAVAADPSYRNRYNHDGLVLHELGLRDEAAASYALMKNLDQRILEPTAPEAAQEKRSARLSTGRWRRADVPWRRLGDDPVAVDDRRGRLVHFDGVGGRIWERLDGARSLPELARELALEFDAPEDDIARDVESFVGELAARGLAEPA